jgi:hypothetical protein
VCHDPLSVEEKKFIAERAQKYQTVVHWKHLIQDLKKRFGKLHSENKIKNHWSRTPLFKDIKLNKVPIKSLLNPVK